MKLVFRADAGTRMGTGHVMRCLALAHAWQDRLGHAVIATARPSRALEARLIQERLGVQHINVEPGSRADADLTIDLARKLRAGWIVLDGYHFCSDYQQAIKEAGLHLLVIDDFGHADHYAADIVLNQNIYAAEHFYPSRKGYTRLLLGTQYVLLRREFQEWSSWQRTLPEVASKVLVTLGGSDPDNVTRRVVLALREIPEKNLRVIVLIGGNNPHREQLEFVVRSAGGSIELQTNAMDMPSLMAWADCAIGAGGTTSWEAAFMALPNALLILADNQEATVKALAERGVSLNLGRGSEAKSREIAAALNGWFSSAHCRCDMARRGRELVDGKGAARTVGLMLEIVQKEDTHAA